MKRLKRLREEEDSDIETLSGPSRSSSVAFRSNSQTPSPRKVGSKKFCSKNGKLRGLLDPMTIPSSDIEESDTEVQPQAQRETH